MSKGCPPLSMNSGTHQLSHAYLRLYSQMGPTSLVPAPLMGTADLVSARIPSVSCLWWDMKTSTNSGWRPPLIFFPQPAHIGLAEHLCLWLRDRRLCKVVLQDLPRTHQWKLIAALLGWVWICCLHSLPFSPHTFFTHTVYSYKRKQNRKVPVPQRDVLELGEPHQGPQSVTVGSFRQHCAMVTHDSQLDRM